MVYDPFAGDPTKQEMFGGERRWVLPAGHYPMRLVVGGAGLTDEYVAEDGAAKGGKPFVELGSSVIAPYPFQGERVQRRLFLTPGDTGAQFHFLRGATAAVTGKTPDAAAFTAFGITLPQAGEMRDRTNAFVEWFNKATPEQRIGFMIQYTRMKDWNGRSAVVRLGVEDGRHPREDGTIPKYNRYIGFWAIDDPTYGRASLADEQARLASVEAAGG